MTFPRIAPPQLAGTLCSSPTTIRSTRSIRSRPPPPRGLQGPLGARLGPWLWPLSPTQGEIFRKPSLKDTSAKYNAAHSGAPRPHGGPFAGGPVRGTTPRRNPHADPSPRQKSLAGPSPGPYTRIYPLVGARALGPSEGAARPGPIFPQKKLAHAVKPFGAIGALMFPARPPPLLLRV